MNSSNSSIQYTGDHPVFIDGFPSECERSCQGSLHLYPRKLTQVTSDELSFLRDKRMDVFRFVRVISYGKEQKSESAQTLASEVVGTEGLEQSPKDEFQEESTVEKKWKKKGKSF